MYQLKTENYFDAAHFLTNYEGKCENLHGHRWRVVAYIQVDELQKEGQEKDMVIDFATFKSSLKTLVDEMDHKLIVEEGSLAQETAKCLENETFRLFVIPFRTTSENFAKYFFDKLSEVGLPVVQTEVYETPLNCAIYRP